MIHIPRLLKLYPDKSSFCWCQCGIERNLLHIMRECESVKSFCNTVFYIFYIYCKWLGSFPIFPRNISSEIYPIQYRTIVSHILFAASLANTNNWRAISALNVIEVIHWVSTHYNYERFLAHNTQSLNAYNIIWLTWPQIFNATGP